MRVSFPRSAASADGDEEKKEDIQGNGGIDKFGILPCRPSEVTETIQNEINKMFPTFSLQIQIKQFITKIGDDAGVANMIEEYAELKGNVQNAENEMNDLKMKMDEGTADESEQNRYNQVFDELTKDKNQMPRFLVKMLRFKAKMLRYPVKMLRFLLKMLRFLVKILRFLVKMLKFLVKMLGLLVKTLKFLREMIG